MAFLVIPAIDLRGGRVVRLRQGDFGQETRYADDPVETARRWIRAGARLLHVVDLDGAREGAPTQRDVVADVVRAAAESGGACEVAGGLRDAASVEAALGTGAARVIVGTAAVSDLALVRDLVDRHGPERIVAALDVRDGQAVGEGWRAGARGEAVPTTLRSLREAGVNTFEVTAIARDGLLGGPDLGLLRTVVRASDAAVVIASGGISSASDLRAVRAACCAGAIVGRALYDGTLTIEEALAASRGGELTRAYMQTG